METLKKNKKDEIDEEDFLGITRKDSLELHKIIKEREPIKIEDVLQAANLKKQSCVDLSSSEKNKLNEVELNFDIGAESLVDSDLQKHEKVGFVFILLIYLISTYILYVPYIRIIFISNL